MKNELNLERAARAAVYGTRVWGGRGRTDHGVTTGWHTPVRVLEGDQAPAVRGLPYWKTQFSQGRFSKVLYTYSTLRIEVGRDWMDSVYSDDTH